jgi:hypothetical protein
MGGGAGEGRVLGDGDRDWHCGYCCTAARFQAVRNEAAGVWATTVSGKLEGWRCAHFSG